MLAGSQAIQMSNTADVPFAYASARVRMLEQRMLSRGDVERLLTAPSVHAGLRVLADTEYASAMATMEETDDYELMLSAELQRVYASVTSFAPQSELLRMWVARYAFLALKMLLKAGFQQETVDDRLLPLWISVERAWLQETARRAIDEELETDADDVTDSKELKAHLLRAARAAAGAYRLYQAPEEIDHAVDALYQQYLMSLTDHPQSVFLRGWVVRFADVTNLSTYVRFAVAGRSEDSLARALLPGGIIASQHILKAYVEAEEPQERYESLSQVLVGTAYAPLLAEGWQAYQKEGLLYGMERLMDRFLQRHLDLARFQPFGLGAVWAYLMAKEREVRLIRLILVGKSAGLSEEQLRERIDYV